MANRAYRIFGKSIEADKVFVFGDFTIGGGGELTSSGVQGGSVISVKHAGTGHYIVQADPGGYASVITRSASLNGPMASVGGYQITVSGITASTGYISLQVSEDGTSPADPPSGSIISLDVVFNLSQLGSV